MLAEHQLQRLGQPAAVPVVFSHRPIAVLVFYAVLLHQLMQRDVVLAKTSSVAGQYEPWLALE